MAKQFDEVTIDLDRARVIRFDINALADLEDALGRSIGQIFNENVGFRELRALLWAGLRHGDRSLTLESAADLIQHAMGSNYAEKFQSVLAKITEASSLAFGAPSQGNPTHEGQKAGTDEINQEANGTGDGPVQSPSAPSD